MYTDAAIPVEGRMWGSKRMGMPGEVMTRVLAGMPHKTGPHKTRMRVVEMMLAGEMTLVKEEMMPE